VANLRFAATVEPGNHDIRAHLELCQSLRRHGLPTLPSSIELELKINPFLRTGVETVKRAVAAHAGCAIDSELETFTVLRNWKNDFRP
jgi:hydroxyacylglutathione hydrolase